MRTQLRNKNKHKPVVRLKLILLAFLALVSIIIFLFMSKRPSKIILSEFSKENGVVVKIYNFEESKISFIRFPTSLQVDASHQLGIWPLKSIWQLGENEGIGGNRLLSASLSKTFKIPLSFSRLSIENKFFLFLLTLKVGEKNIETREIAESLPMSILSLFSDKYLASHDYKIVITNNSGSNQNALDLSKIIETLGMKVSSILKDQENNSDCVILANDMKAAEILAERLSCKIGKNKPLGNYDLEINIGRLFNKRF